MTKTGRSEPATPGRPGPRTLGLTLDALCAVLTGSIALAAIAPAMPLEIGAATVALFVAVLLCAMWLSGMHSAIWRYTGGRDLLVLAGLSVLAAGPASVLLASVGQPWSAALVLPLGFVLTAGGARLGHRVLKTGRLAAPAADGGAPRRVLIAGPGDDTERFIRHVRNHPGHSISIVGALDTDPAHNGRRIRGVPILGSMEELGRVAGDLQARGTAIDTVVMVGKNHCGEHVQAMLVESAAAGLALARAPDWGDFDHPGTDTLLPMQVQDLLKRPVHTLDPDPVRALTQGRVIMVTGAGGSIGSELVRRVARDGPAQIVLLDHSEAALHAISTEMAESEPHLILRTVYADVRDRERMRRVMVETRPHCVLHAAALKHVPLMEHHPREAVLTNVFGTVNTAEAARDAGVKVFNLISTDKAVHPANVMGHTKRAAEVFVQALDHEAQDMRATAVRFGNVLGSVGSVTEVFRHQLARGGPITVTHEDMRRYFMTAEEAAELSLQAAGRSRSADEYGAVYALDMGEPVRILDLAEHMIRLAGLRPYADIDIAFTGLRPGERLSEELSWGSDQPRPTDIEGLMITHPPLKPLAALRPGLKRLYTAAQDHRDVASALEAFHALIHEGDEESAARPVMAAAGAQ